MNQTIKARTVKPTSDSFYADLLPFQTMHTPRLFINDVAGRIGPLYWINGDPAGTDSMVPHFGRTAFGQQQIRELGRWYGQLLDAVWFRD